MAVINYFLGIIKKRKAKKQLSDEAVFLTEMLKGYIKWKGKNDEYAESYRVALNAFTSKDE